MFPGLDPEPLVDELRARLVEELDYTHRGRRTSGCSPTTTRGHPFIHVPAVVDELSTARVLTTELATGARFAEVEQLVAGTSATSRPRAIFRFVFRSLYRLARVQRRPASRATTCSAANGVVTFLDFGLVKRYDPTRSRCSRS